MRSDVMISALREVTEKIADLTIEEADVVLEAARLAFGFRIVTGPTTNGDALELVRRLEEQPP